MACTVKGKDAAHTGEPRMKLATISMIIAVAVAISGVSALAKGKEQKKTEEQVVTIEVTGEGFVPAQVKVKANQAVKLVVTRKTDWTCAKEIVIKDVGINKPLPLNQPVEITFTPTKKGQLRYACAMDMIAGIIVVE
jgi:plastocyanin domain-containing protein